MRQGEMAMQSSFEVENHIAAEPDARIDLFLVLTPEGHIVVDIIDCIGHRRLTNYRQVIIHI